MNAKILALTGILFWANVASAQDLNLNQILRDLQPNPSLQTGPQGTPQAGPSTPIQPGTFSGSSSMNSDLGLRRTFRPVIGYNPDSLILWCQNSLADLDRAEFLAVAAHSKRNYRLAVKQLISGINQALARGSITGLGQTMTSLAMHRVRAYANLLDGGAMNNMSTRTEALFLFNAYKWIRKVSRELDQSYHIRYGMCGAYSGYDPILMETAYIDFAREQLNLIRDNLATTQAGTGYAVPVGRPSKYFRVQAIAAAASASDLAASVFAQAYACQIQQLYELSNFINGYLINGQGMNPLEVMAYIDQQITSVTSYLYYGRGCGF